MEKDGAELFGAADVHRHQRKPSVHGDKYEDCADRPLTESVPPKLYGGTERVVSYITEALVELGHDVTLFASGDSVTSAKLEAVWPRALRLDRGSAIASRPTCC